MGQGGEQDSPLGSSPDLSSFTQETRSQVVLALPTPSVSHGAPLPTLSSGAGTSLVSPCVLWGLEGPDLGVGGCFYTPRKANNLFLSLGAWTTSSRQATSKYVLGVVTIKASTWLLKSLSPD